MTIAIGVIPAGIRKMAVGIISGTQKNMQKGESMASGIKKCIKGVKMNTKNAIKEAKVPHYKVGQILKYTKDHYLTGFGGRVKIPKGQKVIIGADGFAYHTDGSFQPLGDAIAKGYDTEGLANYIYAKISVYFPLDEMLEENDMAEEDFVDEIACALEAIGF